MKGNAKGHSTHHTMTREHESFRKHVVVDVPRCRGRGGGGERGEERGGDGT